MLNDATGKHRHRTIRVDLVHGIVQQLAKEKDGLMEEIRQLRAAVGMYQEVARRLERKRAS